MFKPSLDQLLRSSLRSIWKNKGRTILTSLGIIIGVTSVILLTSIGHGLQIYINTQSESLGSNSIFVAPGKIFNDQGGFNRNQSEQFTILSFTDKDFRDLKRGLSTATVSPVSQITINAKSAFGEAKDISLVGSDQLYGPSSNLSPSPENGRWFTKEEVDKKTRVVILGYDTAQDLFPSGNALGKRVYIKGATYKVIGINDKKGSTFGGPSLDTHIFTSIEVLFDLAGNQHINTFSIKANSKDDVPQIKTKTEKILLEHYEEGNFTVFDSSQLLDSINSIISTLTIALTGIAAISLVVGGIGIMNIMLVTVTERTKEIGLRKAIGAYPRAILLQFLFEATILSGLGGILGISLGTLGTMAINNFFPAQVTFSSISIAFGVSALVGIVFGVTPAQKASRLSPIEALRYE